MKHKDINTQALHHNGHKHIINIEHCINACVINGIENKCVHTLPFM